MPRMVCFYNRNMRGLLKLVKIFIVNQSIIEMPVKNSSSDVWQFACIEPIFATLFSYSQIAVGGSGKRDGAPVYFLTGY